MSDAEALVKRLYQPGEPHVEIQAQLQQLQKSQEGWQLADTLLGSADPNVRFFGALTFTVKLNGHFDAETAVAVLARLKYWLVQLINDIPLVIRKLATTLVTYFIRTPVQWIQPLQDLTTLLGGWNTEEKARFLLLFSGNMADMVRKKENQSHASLHAQLEDEIPDTVNLIQATIHIATDKALQCFHQWTNYGQAFWSGKPAIQALQTLIPVMMETLLFDNIEAALEVFSDLLESYTSLFHAAHLDRLAEILLQLTPSFLQELYTEAAVLVVAFGNATVQDIVEQPRSTKAQAVLPILGAVLQSDDDSLTNITIEFWNTYVEYVSDTSNGDEEWLPNAKEVMMQASQMLWRKMFLRETPDDEFKEFRVDSADLLSSMYIVLGKDMLVQFVNLVLQSLQDSQAVEAGVFCLNALADNALEYEENDRYITPLFKTLFTTDFDIQTRRTIIDMIGQYGTLLKRHPEHIPDAVRYLFASLETPIAGIAARSIYELCSVCRTKLTDDLSVFLSQFSTLSDAYLKEKVCGGIAAIIQALPDEEKVDPLLALISSIEGQDSTLQCLASMGKASQEPEDVDAPVNTFWSGRGKVVQDRIISCIQLDGTGEAVDTVCQILKSGYTELAGPFVFPAAVSVAFLQQCTVETPQVESVLSAIAILISQHSRSNTDRIDDQAPLIMQHITSFMQQLQHPSQDPSVAHNCLEIVSKLLKSYWNDVLQNKQLSMVLSFALQAIESHDILPKRAALDLWSKIIRIKEASNIISSFGPLLTQALIRQVAGIGQRSDLDAVSEPLRELFMAYPAQARQWTEHALFNDDFPPVNGKVGEAEKRRFAAQLVAVRGGFKTREILRDFFALCRGVVSSYG